MDGIEFAFLGFFVFPLIGIGFVCVFFLHLTPIIKKKEKVGPKNIAVIVLSAFWVAASFMMFFQLSAALSSYP